MLDFEPKWFLVLVAIFIFDLIVLNFLLFKPMLRVFKEREDAIDGALDEAREMESDRDTKFSVFKREMSDASTASRNKFESLRQQGLDRQKQLMEAAAKEAASLIEKARAELSAESGRARAALKADVERFSDEIAQKLTKVTG